MHARNLEGYCSAYLRNSNAHIATVLRGRMVWLLRNPDCNNTNQFEALAGCSIEYFRQHIAAQFTHSMSWDSWGKSGWHLDHIKPCASFNLTIAEQINACFHYSNFQPLQASKNKAKNSNWNGQRHWHQTHSLAIA